MTDAATSLATMKVGDAGEIVAVADSVHDPISRRLMALGFVPGTPITVIRRSPMGDPTEYALRGYRLCLRRAEAARVSVKIA